MKRLTAAVFAVALAMSAGAVTATKEWVQTATNDVLRQAKDYADARGGDVVSVNGKTGTVVLAAGDVGAVPASPWWRFEKGTSGGPSWGMLRLLCEGRGDYDNAAIVVSPYGYEGDGIRSENFAQLYGAEFALRWPWGWSGVIATSNMVESIVAPFARTASLPNFSSFARTADLPNFSSFASAASVSNLETAVGAWQAYWGGDDVRVTVTNYYGQAEMPHLYLEEKMQPDETHTNAWFKTVWNETTRWDAFLSAYAAVTNDLRQNYADRAWGVYDSSTGAYSPDDMLQLSQPSIQIASGLSWQKTVLTSGSVWILKATTPATIAGTATNGFIRLLDGDGNTMVEVVKGDKRIVGATATAVEMDGARMRVTYAVTSDAHPVLSLCTDLADPNWAEEGAAGAPASVAWSGASGAWVATVTPVGTRPQMFVRATYEVGGSTYLNAAVPIGFSKVVIGGQEYSVSTATISGQRVLVLQ